MTCKSPAAGARSTMSALVRAAIKSANENSPSTPCLSLVDSGKHGTAPDASRSGLRASRRQSSDAALNSRPAELERVGLIGRSGKSGRLRKRITEAVDIARTLQTQRDIAVNALSAYIGGGK